MDTVGWILVGAVIGWLLTFIVSKTLVFERWFGQAKTNSGVLEIIEKHFSPVAIADISISERQFPFRVRADLQGAIDRVFDENVDVEHFVGIRKEYEGESVTLSGCLVESEHNPAVAIPPEYEDLDIGESDSVRVLKCGLWLLRQSEIPFVVLLSPTVKYGETTGIQFQIGAPNTLEGAQVAGQFFRQMELAVQNAASYRGKILSLEESQRSYSGKSNGITVHKLRTVEREHVILPESTLSLLDRNVIQFVAQRKQLAEFGQSTRKGLLFYGPPGTGKTHTIHYLAKALEGHTTLLISAEQVGLLSEYMTLARLLQPSIVVMEDVDLIARERRDMNSVCEEVLLNKLLNEMDGLKEDADILFILTTNRPETLEAALASRPGRIDQAIEFPVPDSEGRRKLIRLYSGELEIDSEGLSEIVNRTDGVSGAFIKELMRRIIQYNIERSGDGVISRRDIDGALDELLFSGGSLNLKLLGGDRES